MHLMIWNGKTCFCKDKRNLCSREYTKKINEKKFRPEIGVTAKPKGEVGYYTRATYTVWGPIFLGGGADSDSKFNFGLGLEF